MARCRPYLAPAMKKTTALLIAFSSLAAIGQQPDTIDTRELKDVIIRSWLRKDITRLPEVDESYLHTGKKNEQILLAGTNANIAIKTGRQLFAKVPGMFIYDMDGSGNQLNISTRGLDPHRSWELNSRQNGVIINSDMYGYPASHYSPPMESFDKIELVRGAGALQYGAQFGGMINYVTRKPDTTRVFGAEASITGGSYNLSSVYMGISGTSGKFGYYGYYYHRDADGYRRSSSSKSDAAYILLQYKFSPFFTISASLGRSAYLYRLPGPLNDSMFFADPRQATRTRNYFRPDIYVPAFTADWKVSTSTQVKITASGLFGRRNSVLLDAFATVGDTIDASTNDYRNRQVDIDAFHSRTAEGRVIHRYRIARREVTMAAGAVYMNNDLHRRQLGKGTTGHDYDLTLVTPGFGRDMHFRSDNIALFMEHAIRLTSRLTVSPGIRWESGKSKLAGVINYYPADELPNRIRHDFLLPGFSAQYTLTKDNLIYGGIAGAYRPVIFKDIVPASVFERIDKELKDATGYNTELGVRGNVLQHLQYDVSLFSMLYRNRMGTLVLQDNSGTGYTYKTNIGDSRTNGIEAFIQYKFAVNKYLYAGIFTSTSWMHAEYLNGTVSTGSANKSIRGNKVESVPTWITRNGMELMFRGFSCTVLYSYTSSTYSDALNTVTPAVNGAKGLTPGYGIWDFNASYRSGGAYTLRVGIGNLFNKKYFTKRPAFYPGPGIWPSDGRNFYVTLGLRL